MKEIIVKINKTQSWFIEKINKLDIDNIIWKITEINNACILFIYL